MNQLQNPMKATSAPYAQEWFGILNPLMSCLFLWKDSSPVPPDHQVRALLHDKPKPVRSFTYLAARIFRDTNPLSPLPRVSIEVERMTDQSD